MRGVRNVLSSSGVGLGKAKVRYEQNFQNCSSVTV